MLDLVCAALLVAISILFGCCAGVLMVLYMKRAAIFPVAFVPVPLPVPVPLSVSLPVPLPVLLPFAPEAQDIIPRVCRNCLAIKKTIVGG